MKNNTTSKIIEPQRKLKFIYNFHAKKKLSKKLN